MKIPSLNRIVLTGLSLGLVALTQTGCLVVLAAAGAGTGVAYYRGELEATVDAPCETAAQASEAALKDLNITIVSSRATGVDGEIIGRTADDTRVKIEVKSVTERSSKVAIRVGTFGDQTMSNRIMGKINERVAIAPKPQEQRTDTASGRE